MIERLFNFFPILRKFPHLPRIIIFFLDLFCIFLAYLITMFIYTELSSVRITWKIFAGQALLDLLITGVFFYIFKTYSGLLRYSTFRDTVRIWLSLLCADVLLAIQHFIFQPNFPSVLSVFFINFLLSFVLIFFYRMSVRLFFDFIKAHDGKLKILPMLVYGTEPSDVQLAKMINNENNLEYRVIGFISPISNISHQKIIGKPIYFKDTFFSNITKFSYVKAILIQPEDLNRIEKQLLAEICYQNKIELLAIPSIQNWQSDKKRIKEINNINIEDLLGRSPIEIDNEAIRKNLSGKRVLITGAAGSIGSEIVRQLCLFDLELLILCDIAETPLHQLSLNLQNMFPGVKYIYIIADVQDKDKMEYVFSNYRPNCVYHAAAYKHVPMMEENPDESVLNNVLGSKNTADLALAYGAENFVMISTDKAVNPSSVMGASKRIAEIYIQALSNHLQEKNVENTPSIRFITTRFGNVLGSNGSVIPLFEKQIKEGGPVTVTDPNIIRYFMTIPEACSLVLEAGNFGKGGEIFIFDMGEPVKIKDMAEEMIRLSGFKPYEDISIVFTGLRHGEKLYEELLYDKENSKPTHNKKIMVGNVLEQDIHKVLPLINQLIETSYSRDKMEIVRIMKQIVPEFISINSEFSILDK